MVSFPCHAFRYDSLSAEGEDYRDHYILDTSPNRVRRIWTLSIGTNADSPTYGMLQRSTTDDGEFSDGVELPKRLTDHLVSMIPLWTGRRT